MGDEVRPLLGLLPLHRGCDVVNRRDKRCLTRRDRRAQLSELRQYECTR